MKETIETLIEWLNDRNKEYDEGHPTVSDKEYDDKFFKLVALEAEYGMVFPNSPTQRIDYQVVSKLNKVQHNHKMLSLDKTKEVDVVKKFLDNHTYLAMCKMDGLTCSLHYLGGKLIAAETRGNGAEGEDILHNALVVSNIPNFIPYQDELIVDGEIICDKETFYSNFADKYSNPRNFAAGSIRLLDAKTCAERSLSFIAWEVIKGFEEEKYLSDKLILLGKLGFTIVPNIMGHSEQEEDIDWLANVAEQYHYPIDGVVFKFDDIAYGEARGETGHHKKNAIAFKFYDETYPTKLINIEWSMGRTGQITPIAIFEPVEIDDANIERASLHNISIMEELLGEYPYSCQKIEIYRANMIIPQVFSAEKQTPPKTEIAEFYGFFTIPTECPVCGGRTSIKMENDSKVLVCENPDCEGKLINRLDHFCSKSGLDIKGLSKATLSKLMEWGWVRDTLDIMYLRKCRADWIKKPGFGVASVDNILKAIEAAKTTTLPAFISALGIPLIGKSVAEELCGYFDDYTLFRQAIDDRYPFSILNNFGEAKEAALLNFDYSEADEIYKLLSVEKPAAAPGLGDSNTSCKDLKFVITGKLTVYKNRDELVAKIKSLGGSVVSSISKNTSYLINNDVNSTSSKNLNAKKLGIPIISEKDFLEKFDA